ncbi:MAG: hypothetical protein E6Q97_30885 [Desulfurellales bacterium]|nr:MAG: hypothetical protein E6Q97_30885 [Desulfurellales bacterium]
MPVLWGSGSWRCLVTNPLSSTPLTYQLGTSSAEVWADNPPFLSGLEPLPSPPEGFDWRDDQAHITLLINSLLESHRSVFVDAPTGIGKSILALGAAVPQRTIICTSNHALQNQYAAMGIPSITGRKNWPCTHPKNLERKSPNMADKGACTTKFKAKDCPAYDYCPYFIQKNTALASPAFTTNYHYAAAMWRGNPPRSLYIGDEAHSAEQVLRDSHTLTYWLPDDRPEEVITHARAMSIADIEYQQLRRMTIEEEMEGDPDEKPYESIQAKRQRKARTLREIKKTDPETTIYALGNRGLSAIPLVGFWPQVEQALYLSATIFNPYVAQPPGPVAYVRLPSPFPVKNRLVYMDDEVALTYRSPDSDYEKLAEKIDDIIYSNPGRGVIHTPSYSLANRIQRDCHFGNRMTVHKPGDRDAAIAAFRRGERQVLVSPAVSEGVDFPGAQCTWQIIAKLPFPDQRDSINMAIHKATPGLTETTVARTIVQQSGRGVRSKEDVCPTYILDASFRRWFYPRNQELFPKWFRDAVRKT